MRGGSRRFVSKFGKRRLRREAHDAVVKIVELDERGHSPSVISRSVALPETFVRLVLKEAEAVRGEGAVADA